MKYSLILAGMMTVLGFSSCNNKDIIEVYETETTPDMSNAVIQKFTNVMWYKSDKNYLETWTSLNNSMGKSSAPMETMLYQYAWVGLKLNRDGSSLMLFIPPFSSNSYVFCEGKWTTSVTDENTVVVDTKTPVGYANLKIKVRDMQTKDNVAAVSITADVGNRVITAGFMNSSAATGYDDNEASYPSFKLAADYAWFESNKVSRKALAEADFLNTSWANINYANDENKDFASDEKPIRSTYMQDLLLNTSAFISGTQFTFKDNGVAYIEHPSVSAEMFGAVADKIETGKTIVSKAKWRAADNKIIVESDECPAYSMGQTMGLIVDGSNRDVLYGAGTDHVISVWKSFYYVIEQISSNERGSWLRITTPDETTYAFMTKKSAADTGNYIGFREAVKNMK